MPDAKSSADWLVSGTPEEEEAFLSALGDAALRGLPFLWEFWALPHQVAPQGDWRTWIILGGRGA
ncbi:MAG: ATP-binding protein, partial [Phycisphaerales bacterium]